MTKVSKEMAITRSFKLDNKMVRNIWSLVNEQNSGAELSFECRGKHEVETEDVGVLTQYENLYANRIKSIRFNSSYRAKYRVYISISNLGLIYASVSGEDAKTVEHYMNCIREIVTKAYLPYSFIYHAGFIKVMLISLTPWAFGAYLYSYASGPGYFQIHPRLHSLAVLLSVIMMGSYLLYHLTIRIMLPSTIFAIGDGIRRYRTFLRIRNSILGVLGALLIAIIGEVIASSFFTN